jgi:hypothetical protein
MDMRYTTRVIGFITPNDVCNVDVIVYTGFCPYEGTIAVIGVIHFIDMYNTQAESGDQPNNVCVLYTLSYTVLLQGGSLQC